MIRNALTGEPKLKTLEQQKSDFSAEGAPPPGKVGQTPPAIREEPTVPERGSRPPAHEPASKSRGR